MLKGRYENSYINEVFEEIRSRGYNPQDCIVVQMYNEKSKVLQVLVEEPETGETFSYFMKGEK